MSNLSNPNRYVHFLRLLVALLVLFVAQPLVAGNGLVAESLLNLLFVGAVATAAGSVPGRRTIRWAVYGLGATAFISSWTAIVWEQSWIELVVYSSYLGFFTLVCVNVLRLVLDGSEADSNKLYAVCCVYFLAGIAWAFLYTLTETITPGSFDLSRFASGGSGRVGHFIYFSLVTLTTLGYGDVVPVSNFAQTAAALEAIFGQAFLAVLVARLVGTRPSPRNADRTTRSETHEDPLRLARR